MNSFRNRLLALIIGLVVITQSVTLVAVLASTAHSVRLRAHEQLQAGGRVVQQYLQFRAEQLAATVSVLAADFGFREAVASGDAATILSAATNHANRIGADLVLLVDTQGRLLASNDAVHQAADAATVRQLLQSDDAPERARFGMLGGHLHQFFLAPIHAPETIGWAVMGFTVDDALAARLARLTGAQVTIMTPGNGTAATTAASTLSAADHSREYLDYAFDLDRNSSSARVLLQKPMDEVLAPYRNQRNALLAIGLIALLLAASISLLLGRSAARPIGDLMNAARRIQAGTYGVTVEARGGEEFRSLSDTFNHMQRAIAEREERIRHHAWHDPLTGLPNRAGAEQHLEQLLRQPDARLTLILLEIVNLGGINASLGQHVGDEAVSEAARRLQLNCGPGDLTARVGAAQFLVIAGNCTSARAPLLAEQLAGTLLRDFRLAAISLQLEVNAGLCCAPDHGRDAGELLRHAYAALEDAGDEQAHIVIYSAERDLELQRRLTLASDLRIAIERGELTLLFQPKTDPGGGQTHSLEALVRWTHPQLGPVSPAEFIPIAEQTGGTRRLTSAVLLTAIKQMADWQRSGLHLNVAVNLSAPDILDPKLGEEILATLAQHGVPTTRLLLEITESAVIRDPELAVHHMRQLRAAGIRFSLDDFGTGYSSLSQLSRLPLDELKIDRSFIQRALDHHQDHSIVQSTIELAHSLGLKVVAEGVETQQTLELLRRLRCDLIQGYLISRPLPAAEIPPFLARPATAVLKVIPS